MFIGDDERGGDDEGDEKDVSDVAEGDVGIVGEVDAESLENEGEEERVGVEG